MALTGVCDEAMQLRAAGLRVHPCRQRDKIPTVAGWQTRRLGAADLREEVSDGCNLGVALGDQHDGLRLVVVDCDGLDWLHWALERFPAPVLMTRNDPKRGGHLWYAWEGPMPRKRVLAKHATERHSNAQLLTEGAQVVVPPSIHPNGAAYQWIVDGCEASTSEAMLALRRLAVLDAVAVERAAPTPRRVPTPTQMDATRRLAASGVDFASVDLYAAHAAKGMVRREHRNGNVAVDCPWGGGHSEDSASGTAIGRRNEGGWWWRCLHASCEHRTMADLMDALGVATVRQASTRSAGAGRLASATRKASGWAW